MADLFKSERRPAPGGLRLPVNRLRREIDAQGDSGVMEEIAAFDRSAGLISDFERRRNRTAGFRRLGGFGFGSDVVGAMPRFFDPTEFWELSNLPYNVHDDKHRSRLYKWLDLYYRTHPLISILVDIFTRFPLVGMELSSPDKKLKGFYEDVFFDKLDYEQFLVDLGRQYWVFGQSFPLASFEETFGVWEREELIDPMLVKVERVPILGQTQFKLRPPPELVEIAKRKEPRELYHRLISDYPEIVPYLHQNLDIPISDVLLRQVAFFADRNDTYGTPILLRALRMLIHEEKLLASQDAIAERLYSPLIMAKLGIQDLGDNQGPWIPSPMELDAFRDDLDYALSSDFRLIVHHFGVEVQNVFGREQMPRLDADFDRIDRKLMMVFGINPSLLQGGTSGQPYASTALNAEFLNQMLRTYQKYLKRHYEARAMIVAEAQEHYAYEKRGEERIPIMQEVIEYDEEGKKIVVEKNKLMIPDLTMKVLDLRDEATQRQFLFELKSAGVPIPDQDLAIGFDYDFEEALDLFQEELIKKTVAQQEAKVKTYQILAAKGLPIPPELRMEVEGAGTETAPGPPGGPGPAPFGPSPGGGGRPIVMPPSPDLGGPGMPPPAGPRSPQRGQVPEESHERPPPGIVTGPPGGVGAPGTITPPSAFSSDGESEPILKRLPRNQKKGRVVRIKPLDDDAS